MLAIRYRWKGKCPKHRHYNPEKHGFGAVKGNCARCTVLFRVYQAHLLMKDAARVFDEISSSGESAAAIRHAIEVINPPSAGTPPRAEAAAAAAGDGRARLRSAS